MIPFTVDANAINAFQEERIRGAGGNAIAAINAITATNCIALDTEKLCLQEWIDCAGGKFPFALQDWIADQAVTGLIRFYDLSPNTCRQDLAGQGLPQKDHKWIRLAIGSGGRQLVTEDIDFFDPALKTASAAVKQRARQNRRGACARHLRRNYGVDVMCLEHVPAVVQALPEG